MALGRTLLEAQVVHARTRPKRNRFRYRVYYLCIALRDWPSLGRLWPLSLERFNLFSLRARDHGRGQSPEAWIRGVLAEWNVTTADGEIVLMTMPRILGYAFNPVSFWFCLDRQGALRAVLADVTNTFGERHAYLLHHTDQRPIQPDDWLESQKQFHVSPFIAITGYYAFRFTYSEEAIQVIINHHDADGLLLATSVAGKRAPATSMALVRCFFLYPLLTVKVILLIHWQAIRLFLKGIHYHVKPALPDAEITR